LSRAQTRPFASTNSIKLLALIDRPLMDDMTFMEIRTTRFGDLEIEPGDVISFPTGMLGLDDCHQWVLLADSHHNAFGWLQSTDHPEVALAVASPRRFVPAYEVRVARGELRALALESPKDAHVLVTVSKNDHCVTLNLKAPLLIHFARRLGRQVVNNADQPIQYPLASEQPPRKRIA
jgi:flagellar assembly factor FliW